MGKRELQALLDRSGSTLASLCRDLGLTKSAASRWTAEAPIYASWYAASLAVMTPEQHEQTRRLARAKGFDDLAPDGS